MSQLFEVGIEWEGIEGVMKALDQANLAVQQAAKAGVYEAGTAAQKTAQELSPWLEGDLEGSAKTAHDPQGTPSTPAAIVSFSTPYALRRHEEQYRPGPKTAAKPSVDGFRPGRKYLENALKVRTKQIMEYIGQKVRDALARR